MKTRAQIYSHEASGILRDISTYGVLTQKQILGLYPQKDEQIRNLLSYLCNMYAFPLPAENKKSILIDTINNTASFFIITDLRV